MAVIHRSIGEPRRLFAGGPILTMAEPERVEALAVRGGRIAWAGSLADCRDVLGRDRLEVDLGGRCLLPGFVDAHCHPLMEAQVRSWLDVGPSVAPSIETLVDLLRAQAASLPLGRPLRAYGYDHRRFPEGRHPTAADLDRAATDREIHVMQASGHGGVLNSFGLAVHGIDRDTRDVEGGLIGRLPDGRPDGLVWDAACDLMTGPDGVKVGRHGPNIHLPETPARMADLLDEAQRTFLASGVTTVMDAQVTRRESEVYLAARDDGRLRLRVEMLILSSGLEEVLALGLGRRLGDDRLAFAGIKLYADGALGASTAWFPEGYASEPGRTGLLYHEPAEYRELVRRAHAAGLQTGTHVQSPAAIEIVLDALEAAQRAHPRRDPRHRLEHCGLPTDAQIARMARLGAVPVPQPGHHRLFGDGVARAVGEERGSRYNPLGLFAAAGLPLVISSDAPVSPPRPLEAVAAAVERRTVGGRVLGGPELRVDVMTALGAHTWGGAYAIHREGAVGSLEAGKLADLAVLSADPTAVPSDSLGSIAVEETWLEGDRVR